MPAAIAANQHRPVQALYHLVPRIFLSQFSTAMIQLTLTLRDDLAQQAEAYAQAQGKSLNALIEESLQEFLPPVPAALPELPPELARLRGAIQLAPDADYKAVVAEEVAKRFGQ